MRTTLDLPDDLMRMAKIAAATKGLKLKEYFTVLLEREFGSDREAPGQIKQALPETIKDGKKDPHRVPSQIKRKLPVMIPASRMTFPNLTNAEIFEILDEEDDRTHGRLP